jgi:hypothetical protein
MTEPQHHRTCPFCGLVVRGSEQSIRMPDLGVAHRVCDRASQMIVACSACGGPVSPDDPTALLAPDGRAWHGTCAPAAQDDLIRHGYECPICFRPLAHGRRFEWRDAPIRAAMHPQCVFRHRAAVDRARRETERAPRPYVFQDRGARLPTNAEILVLQTVDQIGPQSFRQFSPVAPTRYDDNVLGGPLMTRGQFLAWARGGCRLTALYGCTCRPCERTREMFPRAPECPDGTVGLMDALRDQLRRLGVPIDPSAR